MAGADLRAALVASGLRAGLPPVDLRAVCFVRAMVVVVDDVFTPAAVVAGGGHLDIIVLG